MRAAHVNSFEFCARQKSDSILELHLFLRLELELGIILTVTDYLILPTLTKAEVSPPPLSFQPPATLRTVLDISPRTMGLTSIYISNASALCDQHPLFFYALDLFIGRRNFLKDFSTQGNPQPVYRLLTPLTLILLVNALSLFTFYLTLNSRVFLQTLSLSFIHFSTLKLWYPNEILT